MKAPFRIALRQEGQWWNAYLAKPDTMEGAVEIARLRMTMASDPATKDAFIAFTRVAMERALKVVHGLDIAKWGEPEVAPPHERSGNA